MAEEQERVERLRNVTAEVNGFREEKLTLKGFDRVKALVDQEFEFWNGLQNRRGYADTHRSHFESIRNQLNQIYQKPTESD